MPKYLLIESRDVLETSDVRYFYDLAAQLARAENDVTLFLVQNAVLAARAGQGAFPLEELAGAGVEILADQFSLRERGLPEARLAPGVRPVPLEVVVDRLAEGRKALWH